MTAPSASRTVHYLALAPGNKLVFACSIGEFDQVALMRVNADGSPDTSFE